MQKFSEPSEFEILKNFPRGQIRFALFDFDGTLSLIREGWQDVMISYLVEVLAESGSSESDDKLRHVVESFVVRLTGKQTIYQMIRLAEEVRKRGGCPLDPLAYKRVYHDRLWMRIAARVKDLNEGRATPEEWLVRGSFELLENLKRRGVELYLASGTDEPFVRQEAELLGLKTYFGDRIFGAQDDYMTFSKARVIRRIFDQHRLRGPELVAFGDGYVEVENTCEVGGVAVGVASEESSRSGVNPWKRDRLIAAGAHLIVSDFTDQDQLVAYLFNEN